MRLLAEARLASGRPEATLDALQAHQPGGGQPDDARLIAARALAALGRFAEAAGLLHDSERPDAADLVGRYVWNAGLWPEAARAALAALVHARAEQDREAIVQLEARLAAAAYMAGDARVMEKAQAAVRPDGATGFNVAAAAFLIGPVESAPPRRRVASLLEQTDALAKLADTYRTGD